MKRIFATAVAVVTACAPLSCGDASPSNNTDAPAPADDAGALVDAPSDAPFLRDASPAKDAGLVSDAAEGGATCDAAMDFGSDPKNCGQCGHVCAAPHTDSMAMCISGSCKLATMVGAGLFPSNVAVNVDSIVWATRHEVMRLPKVGGVVEQLASQQDDPIGMVLASNAWVFWADFTDSNSMRRAHSGSGASTIARTAYAEHVAADDFYVYWSSRASGLIERSAYDGTGRTTLVSRQNLGGIVSDGWNVYFMSADHLLRVPCGGGAISTVATTNFATYGLAVDDNYVFWGTIDTVWRVAKSGGAPVAIATGLVFVENIALDATTVYWTDSPGRVMKTSKAGGALAVIANGQQQPYGIAVDDANVYWTDPAAGTVMKTSK